MLRAHPSNPAERTGRSGLTPPNADTAAAPKGTNKSRFWTKSGMDMRLPVSGEISGLSRMRERCADTDWKVVSKWNGAAVDARMKSVMKAKTACATRSRSRIGRSVRETPTDCRRFVRQKSTPPGILAVDYRRRNGSSARNEQGYRDLWAR